MMEPGSEAVIGRRVRARRLALSMTQIDLAVAARLRTPASNGSGYISAMEHGKYLPSYSTIVKLCRALQWTPNDFFGWDQGEPS